MSTHQQITEARILDYLSESNEREARARTDYSPTIRAATHSEALSAMSWFLRGEGDLGRAALRKLTPAQLAKAQLAAVLFINASGEIAEDLTAAAVLTPDSPELPSRLAQPCAWCGEPDCPERFDHDRLDAGSETTWRRRRADQEGNPS